MSTTTILDLSKATPAEFEAAAQKLEHAIQALSNPETMFTVGEMLAEAQAGVRRMEQMNAVEPAPLKMPAHFGPTPLPGEREHSDNLYRAVRQMARDICDAYAWETRAELNAHIAEAQTWPEWRTLRALYFAYCAGFEDAFYECLPVLACAIRDGKSAWLGDIAMEAWSKYADEPLIERVLSKIQEIREDDAAINQAESVGR